MGSLTWILGAALAVAAAPAAAEPLDRYAPHIAEAAQRFGIPRDWIERVVRAESGGRTTVNGRPIVSRAGAMGLMQLMPGTWAELRATLHLGGDPHAPRDNILAGTYYLRLLHDRFGYPGLFAAYNAGPARYAAYLAGRARLPAETRAYLATIGRDAPASARPRALPGTSPPPLFVIRNPSRNDATTTASGYGAPRFDPGLFAIERGRRPRASDAEDSAD